MTFSVNKCCFGGHLGADPKKFYTSDGKLVVSFSVCTNEFKLDAIGQPTTVAAWHDIVAFGPIAERAAAYLKKGSCVLVDGTHRVRTVLPTDGVGAKRYFHEFIASSMQFVGARTADSPQEESAPYGEEAGLAGQAPPAQRQPSQRQSAPPQQRPAPARPAPPPAQSQPQRSAPYTAPRMIAAAASEPVYASIPGSIDPADYDFPNQ